MRVGVVTNVPIFIQDYRPPQTTIFNVFTAGNVGQ